MAGDSAGGGLAVALLVATRDAGQALPAAAVLMSPTVDLTSSGASMTERADQDPISTPAMLRQFASDYLAGADPKTPLASPLFASLSGLPPLLIQVGTADLLLSDSERLAAAAAEAGVDVTLRDRRGPAPRLPDHARHPRGSRGHRADREVPHECGHALALGSQADHVARRLPTRNEGITRVRWVAKGAIVKRNDRGDLVIGR